MPLANVFAWIIARYRAVSSVVLRAIVADLFNVFDLASDLYTIESLFTLGHAGPASALLSMVCLTFAFQVTHYAPMRCRVARAQLAAWYPMESSWDLRRRCF
jgi:hypothetical protein